MGKIKVNINHSAVGDLFYEKETDLYGFNYTSSDQVISLIMPHKPSTYESKHHLHPIFDMNMPEGYLYEMLKNYLSKHYGVANEFTMFSYLCGNIQSRLSYSSAVGQHEFESLDINEIINNDNEDTFVKLVKTYLGKNAISGVQPKSLARLQDKESLQTKEYIIKTWGAEYPELALNEYFCLKAVQYAGVEIPNIRLSSNNRFLLVERFNLDQKTGEYYGFEEVLTLLGKNKEQKYNGSYEQIAKVIYTVVADKIKAMNDLYKMIVMSYLLRNGDAHLKNFGVLYDADIHHIRLAPAYDIVNTCVYFYKDRPALTMFGKKLWLGKKELLKFGKQHCVLSSSSANALYNECIDALKIIIKELQHYILTHNEFKEIGNKIIETWSLSLEQKTVKEVPLAVVRRWSQN